MNSGFLLKEDFVIPKGTRFDLKDCDTTFYKGTNFEALISVNPDNCGHFIVGCDVDDEKFMPIPEAPYDAYFSYVEYKHMWNSLWSAKCGNKELEISLKALMKDIEDKYQQCRPTKTVKKSIIRN